MSFNFKIIGSFLISKLLPSNTLLTSRLFCVEFELSFTGLEPKAGVTSIVVGKKIPLSLKFFDPALKMN